MEVRHAGEDESGRMGLIYCESWKAAYKGIVPDDYLNSLTVENCTPKKMNPAKNLVVLDGEACVGLCNISPGRDDGAGGEGEICAIYLLPDYFGKGFAKPLFERGVRELRGMGFTRQYLWVLADNARARSFYEKNGFHANGETRSITISGAALWETKYVSG